MTNDIWLLVITATVSIVGAIAVCFWLTFKYTKSRNEVETLRLAFLRKKHQIRNYREELDRDLQVLTDDCTD